MKITRIQCCKRYDDKKHYSVKWESKDVTCWITAVANDSECQSNILDV